MTDFNRRLRLLCEATANFTVISREIFIVSKKRRQALKQFATELKIAAENFLKVCEELEHEQT